MTNPVDLLTPDTRERAIAFQTAAQAAGLAFNMGRTRVTCAAQGMSTAPVMVNGIPLKRAPGCRSWHVWGRAFDVTLQNATPERYAELGALGKSMGLAWGGDFATNFDPIHFQYAPGLSTQILCPDPAKCEETVAAYEHGLPPPPPSPPSSDGAAASFLAFAAGAIGGFLLTRRMV